MSDATAKAGFHAAVDELIDRDWTYGIGDMPAGLVAALKRLLDCQEQAPVALLDRIEGWPGVGKLDEWGDPIPLGPLSYGEAARVMARYCELATGRLPSL